MKLAALKNYFANWREWEFNPIVIKELRQGVRSWTVTGMLLLFLIILFITSLGFLITSSFDVNANMGLGGTMFSTFTVILAGASVFFIPLIVAVRVAQERQENNPDLLYVSTLSPFRIVLGKFLCGAYTAVLFFSACMPFMAFTNLLRGVDLPTVFFILAFLFLVVCAANMFAIFLACLPVSRAFKFLFLIYGIFQSFGIIGSMVGISFEFMRSGIGAMMSHRDFWIATVTAAGIILMITGLFFVLSVALISPPSANRALPVRIYLTGVWILSGVLALIWVVQSGDGERMAVWAYPTFIIMMTALLVTISNSDELSLRVRRKIPSPSLKRFFAFFFFNGAAGGLIWVAAILALTYFATRWTMFAFSRTVSYTEVTMDWFITTALYAFDYALLALFLQRKFLPRRPPKLAGLLAVILAGAWALAPGIFLFFANQLSWKSIDGFQPGNIFNVFSLREGNDQMRHQIVAFVWLVLMLVLNAKWFRRQVQNFRPPPAAENVPPVLS
jgi:hypothetical protein